MGLIISPYHTGKNKHTAVSVRWGCGIACPAEMREVGAT